MSTSEAAETRQYLTFMLGDEIFVSTSRRSGKSWTT